MTWELGTLSTWELGNLGTWELGNLSTCYISRQQKKVHTVHIWKEKSRGPSCWKRRLGVLKPKPWFLFFSFFLFLNASLNPLGSFSFSFTIVFRFEIFINLHFTIWFAVSTRYTYLIRIYLCFFFHEALWITFICLTNLTSREDRDAKSDN